MNLFWNKITFIDYFRHFFLLIVGFIQFWQWSKLLISKYIQLSVPIIELPYFVTRKTKTQKYILDFILTFSHRNNLLDNYEYTISMKWIIFEYDIANLAVTNISSVSTIPRTQKNSKFKFHLTLLPSIFLLY